MGMSLKRVKTKMFHQSNLDKKEKRKMINKHMMMLMCLLVMAAVGLGACGSPKNEVKDHESSSLKAQLKKKRTIHHIGSDWGYFDSRSGLS
ncbi:hypothetical protein RWE15_14090 [Virgibacillus halophilus]|uniref:Uncharacterized protein n=1 Tax=Tigheibacillus halophilus TaxID=361280 RepID=A0ABU5C8I8_9BACI|nr:hypothetical protein [Virgibacillus halophilus]